MADEKYMIEFQSHTINLNQGCDYCVLRREVNDCMNITFYCHITDKVVDVGDKCHLSEEEYDEFNGKEFVYERYITERRG